MASFTGTRGADVFVGTAECDQFYVNNQADVIIGGGAGDVVSSSIDYVLDAGITSLIITGRAQVAIGNSQENFVVGNRHDNIINGGRGIDRLAGGAGADTFVFDAAGRQHADYLSDFTSGTDRLAISGEAFGVAAGAVFGYQVGWDGLGAGPTFIREEIEGLAPTIWFDADGAGGVDAQILCTLQRLGNATAAADFAIL